MTRYAFLVFMLSIFMSSSGCSVAKAPPSFTEVEKKVVVNLVSIFDAKRRGELYFKDPDKLRLRPSRDVDESELTKLVKDTPEDAAAVAVKLFQRSAAWWDRYQRVFSTKSTRDQEAYALEILGRVVRDYSLGKKLARVIVRVKPDLYSRIYKAKNSAESQLDPDLVE